MCVQRLSATSEQEWMVLFTRWGGHWKHWGPGMMMRRAYFREEDLLSFTWKLGKITGEWGRWHVVKGGCIWVLRVRIKGRDNAGDAIKGRLMNLVANLEMDMMKSGDNVGFRPGRQKQWMTPATEMGKGRGDFKFFQKVIVWLGASWPWG